MADYESELGSPNPGLATILSQSPHTRILAPDNSRFIVDIFERNNAWYGFSFRDEIDLTNLPPGEKQVLKSLNLRTSRQFSISNRGLVEKLADKSHVKHLISSTRDPRVIHILQHVLETKCLPPLTQDDVKSDYLYHGGGVRHKRSEWNFGRSPIDKVKTMKERGVYGPKYGRVTYVTSDFHRAIAHSPRGVGSENVLLKIAVGRLLEKRSVFNDPESLSMVDEFGHNFVVPRGIPVSAIEGAYLLRSDGESSPD
ncbi:hypothetical protein ACFL2C_01220 [Patescibacteria group bacterium]